jgi:hypothetical protein
MNTAVMGVMGMRTRSRLSSDFCTVVSIGKKKRDRRSGKLNEPQRHRGHQGGIDNYFRVEK